MTTYTLSTGHKIVLYDKLGNGDIRVGVEGHFERGEGVLSQADARAMVDKLLVLLDRKALVMPVASGTAVEVAAVDDEA